jgi:putative ABC transport system permease protein
MLQNYLKIAFRSLLRQKSYALINIVGLAVGLTCTLLICLHIADDFSFDRFHTKHERIFRFTQQWKQDTQMPANTAPAWADILKSEIPQVESTVRFYQSFGETLIDAGETKLYEKEVKFADANVFDVFDFALVEGNPRTALLEPRTVVLTESAARRYFGNSSSMGKTIRYDNKFDLKVTGIMRDVPANSHLQFTMLGSMETVKRDLSLPDGFKSLYWNPFLTYMLLREGASAQAMMPLLERVKEKYAKDIPIVMNLQALAQIHLVHENALSTIYFLAAIGCIILLLACINYTNLATARFSIRAREVGVRKTLGATRLQLAAQFWGESFLLTAIALTFALFAAELTLPAFNTLTNKHLSLTGGNVFGFVGGIALALVVVSTIAGVYPAVFLSAFKPATALRRTTLRSGATRFSLRSVLVVVQFSMSIVMIIGTLVVQNQLAFIQSKNLGFDREQVVLVQLRGDDDMKQSETLKTAFLGVSGIRGVSISSVVPGRSDVMIHMPIESKYLPAGDNDPSIKWLCIDEGFLPLYGIQMKEGRNLNGSTADENEAFILNEAAVRKLKWEKNAVGREIGYSVGEKASNWSIEKHGRVVGVVPDFHVGTLRNTIEPLLIHIKKAYSRTVSIKLPKGDPRAALVALEAAWKRTVPQRPFEYTFLDDDFNASYKREQQLRSVVAVFAGLAIFVSCLGLLGLAAFTAESRTKEIGIRKVLGASVASIVALLSKDFLVLVLIAIVIATPLAYWFAGKWLQDFAYRVELTWWVFAAAGVVAVVIAFLTVATQAWKAARQNPVNALRSE